MSGEIPSYAKYIFLLGFITAMIFGVWAFLSPESYSAITGWPLESASTRLVGSFLITFGFAAILAFRATSWKEVELYVLMIIMWTILGSIAMVWSTLVVPLPIIGWLLTGLLMMFFVLYLYVYMQGRSS
ncbi:MAG: hypothetical protein ACXABV_03540 [Candidatus Thorarchaeota archaeon]|jgi:uncharacterized membrane protein